mmetsp:Transcript_83405/g.214789  ORF Transcript_83405/g.214789 Transcript_83405/m.214789 type:complete len:215 (+) Transcript_83405:546-1190(+)
MRSVGRSKVRPNAQPARMESTKPATWRCRESDRFSPRRSHGSCGPAMEFLLRTLRSELLARTSSPEVDCRVVVLLTFSMALSAPSVISLSRRPAGVVAAGGVQGLTALPSALLMRERSAQASPSSGSLHRSASPALDENTVLPVITVLISPWYLSSPAERDLLELVTVRSFMLPVEPVNGWRYSSVEPMGAAAGTHSIWSWTCALAAGPCSELP